jgi:hypothetical protein
VPRRRGSFASVCTCTRSVDFAKALFAAFQAIEALSTRPLFPDLLSLPQSCSCPSMVLEVRVCTWRRWDCSRPERVKGSNDQTGVAAADHGHGNGRVAVTCGSQLTVVVREDQLTVEVLEWSPDSSDGADLSCFKDQTLLDAWSAQQVGTPLYAHARERCCGWLCVCERERVCVCAVCCVGACVCTSWIVVCCVVLCCTHVLACGVL